MIYDCSSVNSNALCSTELNFTIAWRCLVIYQAYL